MCVGFGKVYGSPPASGRRGCESSISKVFPPVKVPDDRDFPNEVAHLWDGEVHGPTAGVTAVQRLTEVVISNHYGV